MNKHRVVGRRHDWRIRDLVMRAGRVPIPRV